jgi:biotin carboxyl carrier protein
MKLQFEFNSQSFPIELTPAGNSLRATVGDRTFDVDIVRAAPGQVDLLIDHQRVTVTVTSDNAKRWVTVNGRTFVLTVQTGARKSGGGHHHTAGELTAPMPGQVRAVNVREGEAVTKGQTLLVLEAMKMEIRIQSPGNGTVKAVFATQGQTVEREQILIEIE